MRMKAVLLSTVFPIFLVLAGPRVQTLVPGLVVSELPVQLTNVNSLEYGPNGRLYTVGYDGRIHVLTDSDGDGVEDQAVVYWSEPGDLLTPVGILPRAEGVYVAARGKIALIRDTDGDGVADVSDTLVSGWEQESYNSDTRNDAAGLAIDPEGNLYFSLGCMSYNKAWLLDKQGRSHYDRASERGTILKVAPDRKERDIVATGLRFVFGLAFNRRGDLFATDQEGDTWFPGGNPRDELLHIIPGRHYGFPFRHPDYNSDAIDEPEVVGFSPQHQSTCGFRFNEAGDGRKPFGPEFWEDNAIVAGFSRGKLWRVPLAKTDAGYVGKQIQIAAFESLLTDVTLSPRGDLIVSSHGGKPDWGSGPAATGFLHRIRWNESTPQVVTAWPSGPMETTIAFDRALKSNRFSEAEIESGDFAWEGDRYEWIWPGYEVVKAEKRAPRRAVTVDQIQLSNDRRNVILTTSPQHWRSRYRVSLGDPTADDSRFYEGSYDFGGVQATWTRSGGREAEWSGWLPHTDSDVVAVLTKGSSLHERLRQFLRASGQLTIRSQLHLPGRKVKLFLASNHRFQATVQGQTAQSIQRGIAHELELSLEASPGRLDVEPSRGGREQVLPTERVAFEIATATGDHPEFTFHASYQADFDPYIRPLRLEHLSLPWAPENHTAPEPITENSETRELRGDAERGRELFFGPEANCAACHQFDGRGGTIAADLTVSRERAAAAVLQDIVDPNAAINPDYVAYELFLENGESLSGLIQSTTADWVTIVDSSTQARRVLRSEITDLRASRHSLMPVGYEALGEDKLNDLLAFLCGK